MVKLISFVLPVYNEGGGLKIVQKELDALMSKISDYRFEVIYVNDGSSDDSLKELMSLAKKSNRIKIVNLSRNFGHQAALTAGLNYAAGDGVITMDSDLQDPPAVCAPMIKKWESGFDVVYAKRESRDGESLFKRLSANVFYRLLNRLSDIDIPQNVGDFRLMDKKVVDELKKFRESHRYLRGLISYVGFRQTFVPFSRSRRIQGETKYPLRKMLRLASDAVTGFSDSPLRLASKVGYLVALGSLLGILYALGVKIFTPESAVPGWAFITIAIFFMGGVQLIMLGIIGHYIGRTYTQTQNRPLYIVSSVYQRKKGAKVLK